MNIQSDKTILDAVDPDLSTAMTRGRRGLFAQAALSLGAMASAPLVLAVSARQAFGATLPQQIMDTLNFALTLEHIEDAFYRSALDAKVVPAEHLAATASRCCSWPTTR